MFILLSVFVLATNIMGINKQTGEFLKSLMYNKKVYSPYFDNGREVQEIWSRGNISIVLYKDSLYDIYLNSSKAVNYPVGSNPKFVETNLILNVDSLLSSGSYIKKNDTLELKKIQEPKNFILVKNNSELKDNISITIVPPTPVFYSTLLMNFDDGNNHEWKLNHYNYVANKQNKILIPNSQLTDNILKNLLINLSWRYDIVLLDLEDLTKNSIKVFDIRKFPNQPINDIYVYLENHYPDFEQNFKVEKESLIPINRIGSNIPLDMVSYRNLMSDQERYRAVYINKGREYERIYYNPEVKERIKNRK